ncbi:MAG: hypothetical protein R6U57_07615 [Anaerolineales bacterium]
MSCCEGHHHRGHHDRHHSHDRGPHHEHCRGHDHHGRGNCCCGGGRHHGEGHFRRRYITRDEEIERLEGYLEDLQMEAKAVEERLADLREDA